MADRNEAAKRKAKEEYERRYGDRDRKRERDAWIKKWMMEMHGNDVPEYPELPRDAYFSVLQVYHQKPFNLTNREVLDVNWDTSMREWAARGIEDVRQFVLDLVTVCTTTLCAPAKPANIKGEVIDCSALVFNRFIYLCKNRRPDLAAKWKIWEGYPEMETD